MKTIKTPNRLKEYGIFTQKDIEPGSQIQLNNFRESIQAKVIRKDPKKTNKFIAEITGFFIKWCSMAHGDEILADTKYIYKIHKK